MRQIIDKLVAEIDRSETPALAELQTGLRQLVERLLAGAAPREALLNLARILETRPDLLDGLGSPLATRAFASVLSSGPALTGLIARAPERLQLLQDPRLGQAWGRNRLKEALLEVVARSCADATLDRWPIDQIALGIATFRNDQFVRLAACEFGISPLEQVGRELSDLADVCLEVALSAAAAHHRGADWSMNRLMSDVEGIVAIAMGKHGACELNFCSDIDLVFIYDTDERGIAGVGSHEYHSRVCREVVKLLSALTSEGVAFRVDLRLRPEGSRGPICNSLGSAERYYETWGGPYDRLAWLKARAAAGDIQLGKSMLAILTPFVFPRATSVEVVEHIQQLSDRIRAELSEQRQLVEGWNVKLGVGGIRDVEFFVQALQLLHGGRRAALRARSTLAALDRLLYAGLISGNERGILAEAYELYRRLEHRLQLYGGRQTHLLPNDGPLRAHITAHMGYSPESFDQELARYQEAVSQTYATLGVVPSSGEQTVQLVDGRLSDDQEQSILREMRFADPERAREQLQVLRGKPWGPFSSNAQGRLRQLALDLLREVAASPDPDAALRHLVSMALRVSQLEGPWLMLAENEAAMRLLCSLFGSSDLLSELFIGQPELLDQLLLAGRAAELKTGAEMRQQIAQRVKCAEVEDCFGALEKYRNEEVLRIGLHDIAGGASLEDVWAQLSELAEQIVDRSYQLVYAEAVKRYGRPRRADGSEATMIVIGLGKLGAREMSYGSDLDLIFVHSGEGETDGRRRVDNSEFFAKVAQRLIRALTSAFVHGKLYEVDTRLRPSGSQGTLVSSLQAFEAYHAETAQIWERQVLTKARPVGGDPTFAAEVQRRIQHYVYETPLASVDLRAEIVRLRRRMERELAGEDGETLNIKLGRGGLLDVEFVAQYLQLCFGQRIDGLRTQRTLDVIREAAVAGLIDSATSDAMIDGYRFLRRLEGRIRVVRGRSAERLPASPGGAEGVARRLGYRKQSGSSPGAQLLLDYRRYSNAVRRAFERVFALPLSC